MDYLQNLRKRSEGFGYQIEYDSVLGQINCIQSNLPPPEKVNSRLTDCAFAKKLSYGNILAATCEDGQLIILNTAYDSNKYNITQAHSQMLFSIAWSDIDMKLITACGDLTASLWTIKEDGRAIKTQNFLAHKGSVKTACFLPYSSDVFASGGRDGNIFVWDARCPDIKTKPEQCIINGHSGSAIENKVVSITCVVFQNEYKLLSCADKDSYINVWDLRKTYIPYKTKSLPCYRLSSMNKKSSHGYTHIAINKNRTEIFTNSLNNSIYCYNLTSLKPAFLYDGHVHRPNDFYVKCDLSPDEKYLVSTDSDNKIFIWKIKCSKNPIIRLDGEHEGLSGISWCPEDNLKIATSSDNFAPWIWRVPFIRDNNGDLKLNDEKKIQPEGTATVISVLNKRTKCENLTAMAQYLKDNTIKNTGILKTIKLPNAVDDGGYQVHTCIKVKSKNDWLTNLHNQRTKDNLQKHILNSSPVVNKSITLRSPNVTGRNKLTPKRKRRFSSPNNLRKRQFSSPNNLTKYFKVYDEN